MKSAVVFLVFFACIAQNEAFIVNLIGGAINTIQNTVNNTVNTVNGHIDNINNVVNIASLGGQFLWDNSLKPTLDTFTNS